MNRNAVTARDIGTGKTHTEGGSEYRHPRLIIGRFEAAQLAVRRCVYHVNSSKLIRPILVIHWTEEVEGGLSTLELRALKEIGYSCWAYAVYLMGPNIPVGDVTDEFLLTVEKIKGAKA